MSGKLFRKKYWERYSKEVVDEARNIILSPMHRKEKIRLLSMLRLRVEHRNRNFRLSKNMKNILNVLHRGAHTVREVALELYKNDDSKKYTLTIHGRRKAIKDSVLFSINRSIKILNLRGLVEEDSKRGYKDSTIWKITQEGIKILNS